jgi:signal transduction histidine kinase
VSSSPGTTAAAGRVIAAMTGSSLRRTPVRFPDDARAAGVGYRRKVPPIPSLTSSPSRADALDAALAGGLAILAVAEVLTGQVSGPRAAAVPLALLMTLPLAVRRMYPLAVTAAVSASFLLNWAAGVDMYSYWATIFAGLITAYTAAAHLRPRLAALALACLYAAIAVSSLHGPGNLLWGGILIGGAALAGFALRDRRRHVSQLAELARQLELARDENARAAVAGERARIARELHDVVAHSVSVMVVQAGAAEEVLGADPARAREPLRSVQDTGRQALVELRRLLGVLRTDDGEAALAPQPGLDQVGALAAQVRDAGVAVELSVDGDRDGIPAGVDLAAYRIVQEALTNVLKHASASHAVVRVGYRPDAIELEVLDDGHGPLGVGNGGTGTGQGLIGMRERASLYGGALEARPQAGGGFAVRARLPVRSAG